MLGVNASVMVQLPLLILCVGYGRNYFRFGCADVVSLQYTAYPGTELTDVDELDVVLRDGVQRQTDVL